MLDTVKYLLTKIGVYTSENGLARIVDSALNYIEVGRWMRAKGYDSPRLRSREEIFDLIGHQVADEHVLYLEFGVWHGASIRYWSGILRNPLSRLHGFDSFEGLPEKWHVGKEAGFFSMAGAVPEIDDRRVEFFKGWFHDTLSCYTPPEHDRLIINVDSDLYSSAKEILGRFAALMRPGTFLYFDEFSDRNHEMKAFDEFLANSGHSVRLVGATRSLSHVVFEVTA
jgi:hypothetical protein